MSDHNQEDHNQNQKTKTELEPTELKEWQKAHLERKLKEEIDLDGDEDFRLSEEPESEIQGIVKDIFQTLRDNPKPDSFDKFYENSEMDEYPRKDLVAEFIKKLMDKVNVSNSDVQDIDKVNIEELKTQEGMDKSLKAVAENLSEGDSDISSIKKIIEEDYPELVSEEKGTMSPAEYRDKYEKFIEKQIEKMAKGIEPKQNFKDYFDDFKAYNNHEIDDIASTLNNKVDLGIDTWKLILYSTLSAQAKRFYMGGRPARSSLHTLLIGDIATAKSKALNMVEEISPKAEKVDSMTPASFIGNYDNSTGEIEEGVVDEVLYGNLIFHEYDKMNKDDEVIRPVFDNDELSVRKGGETKIIEKTPISVIAGANPEDDFFTENGEGLRGQINFKEGELSRFDILIPLVNTPEQMEKYTENMSFFKKRESEDLSEYKQLMDTLKTKINKIEETRLGEAEDGRPPLEQQLRNKFNNLQEELDSPHRPTLIIMRDLEVLMRLTNIIGCVHEEPNKEGVITISQESVDKATSQFEELIYLRKQLYDSESRKDIAHSTKEQIELELITMTEDKDEVSKPELKNRCLREGIVNNKATFYNKINELIREERVVETDDKEKYTTIKPVN